MSTVAVEFYLIIGQRISSYGWTEGKPSVRTSKGKPVCEAHEVPLFVSLNLPLSVFQRPALKATITVPDSSVPAVIESTVQENITALLKEQLGVNVLFTAPPEPEHG